VVFKSVSLPLATLRTVGDAVKSGAALPCSGATLTDTCAAGGGTVSADDAPGGVFTCESRESVWGGDEGRATCSMVQAACWC
jgi:hypothetical protein